MGQQARLKRARREERQARSIPSAKDEPFRILKAIHKTIQDHCHENSRRCWEYLLEMMAHATGWETDTREALPLWDKMANETRWEEFVQSWNAEVEWAKANGTAFSEPFGELLEQLEGTSDRLGQFFTPMAAVRMINQVTLEGTQPPYPDGMPSERGLDPTCGTGRFMIDALVHNEGLVMHGVDLDLWMLRCAMMNVRLLARWTSLHLKNPDDRLKPLRSPGNPFDMMVAGAKKISRPNHDEDTGDTLLIGGRSIFMNADALIVDLDHTPNWLCAGWHWGPRPWRGNLKIAGYDGTYDDWDTAGRPPLFQEEKTSSEVRFDYSMRADPAQAGAP